MSDSNRKFKEPYEVINELEEKNERYKEALERIAAEAPCSLPEFSIKSKHDTFCIRHTALAALREAEPPSAEQ